jgi:hypothetical protein
MRTIMRRLLGYLNQLSLIDVFPRHYDEYEPLRRATFGPWYDDAEEPLMFGGWRPWDGTGESSWDD